VDALNQQVWLVPEGHGVLRLNEQEGTMIRLSLRRALLVVLALAVAGLPSCGLASDPKTEADLIRTIEHQRIDALVAANMEVARQLHADDFQLVDPTGSTLSKDQFLGEVASGEIDFLVWEPQALDVRVYGQAAVIRYQSQIEVVVGGQKIPRGGFWHTDSYEKRDGRWQAVWEQTTEIR